MKASKISAIDFFDDLGSMHARRRFIGFFAFAILLFTALSFALSLINLDNLYWLATVEVISAIFISVASGSSLILIFYLAYFHFIGPNFTASSVVVLRPEDINDRVRGLSRGTSEYYLWGRSASFFRSSTLVTLNEEAAKKRSVKNIIVLIPDPSSGAIVKSYNRMTSGLDVKSHSSLQVGVVATCLTCAFYAANNRFLRVELYLSNYIPAFRIDMSEGGALLTQDDPKKSSLFLRARGEFCEMFKSSIYNEIDLSKRVNLQGDYYAGKSIDDICVDIDLINNFNLDFKIDETDLNEIEQQFKNPSHRYKK